MQQADSSPSALEIVAGAISRALVVFIGGSVAGFWLLSASDGPTGQAAELGGFFSLLGDALSPTAEVSNALGNTMYLGAVAIIIGLIVGALVGGLARVRAFRPVLGPLAPMALAVFAPGFLLLPIALAATTEGNIASGPLDDGVSFGDSLPFMALWGGLAGLSLVPGIASRIASGRHGATFGGQIASASLAARTEGERSWSIGFPTTAFLVALTAAELLSGHRGLIALLRDSLELGSLSTSFEIIVLLVSAGALLAAAIDATGGVTPTSDETPPPGPIQRSRAAIVFFGILAMAVVAAAAGYGLNAPVENAADAGLDPFSGGPWLGTDEAGRSLAVTVAKAIGPSLVFSFLAATVAAVLGIVVAVLRHTLPIVLGRILGTVIDLFWWPTVLFFPLISSAFGSPDRPEIDSGILLVSGLALTPFASRLLGRTVFPATDKRSLRALSGWVFIAAVSLSIHLVAAFMAPFGSGEHMNLGRMIADGFGVYQDRSWPFLLPAFVGAMLLAAQYYLAAALTAPAKITSAKVAADEASSPEPPPEPVVADADDQETPLAAAPGLPDVESPIGESPITAEASQIDIWGQPVDETFDQQVMGSDDEVGAALDGAQPESEQPVWQRTDDVPVPGKVSDWTELGPEPQDVTVASPTPPTLPSSRRTSILESSDPADDSADLDIEASRTVELRPSTIRMAVANAEAARIAQEATNRQAVVPPPDQTTGAGQRLATRSVLGTDEVAEPDPAPDGESDTP